MKVMQRIRGLLIIGGCLLFGLVAGLVFRGGETAAGLPVSLWAALAFGLFGWLILLLLSPSAPARPKTKALPEEAGEAEPAAGAEAEDNREKEDDDMDEEWPPKKKHMTFGRRQGFKR